MHQYNHPAERDSLERNSKCLTFFDLFFSQGGVTVQHTFLMISKSNKNCVNRFDFSEIFV